MPTNPNNGANRRVVKKKPSEGLQKQKNQPVREKEDNLETGQGKGKQKRLKKKRAFPIWLRIIVVLVLCIAALLVGLMIGYGVIGDGNATDAIKVETWRHIYELVEGQK